MKPILDVQYTGQMHHISHFLQQAVVGTIETVYFAAGQGLSIKVRYRGQSFKLDMYQWLTLHDDGTLLVSDKKIITALQRACLSDDW